MRGLPSEPSFLDLAIGTVDMAGELYGHGRSCQQIVAEAWAHVGIETPLDELMTDHVPVRPIVPARCCATCCRAEALDIQRLTSTSSLPFPPRSKPSIATPERAPAGPRRAGGDAGRTPGARARVFGVIRPLLVLVMAFPLLPAATHIASAGKERLPSQVRAVGGEERRRPFLSQVSTPEAL